MRGSLSRTFSQLSMKIIGSRTCVPVIFRVKTLSQQRLVFYSRMAVIALVILALILGMLAEKLVFWLVLFAWAGLGASIGPTSILALYWRRTSRAGIAAGLITGTIVTIIWHYTPFLKEVVYELVPGFILGMCATILVSCLTKAPDGTQEMFEAMRGDVKGNSRDKEL